MDKPRPISPEQFKDAAKRLLLKKPEKSAVPDDYEPTEEELEEVYLVESVPPSDQDD